jgi:hypothetical protein
MLLAETMNVYSEDHINTINTINTVRTKGGGFNIKAGVEYGNCEVDNSATLNPLMPELNPSTQRYLTRFYTGDFAS